MSLLFLPVCGDFNSALTPVVGDPSRFPFRLAGVWDDDATSSVFSAMVEFAPATSLFVSSSPFVPYASASKFRVK